MTYWIVRFLTLCISKIFFPFKVYGLENIPSSGSFIYASNHISYLDPVVLAISCQRRISFVAKDTLFKNPVVVPSIKKQAGIDFFYAGIPFDLKVTNLPKSFLENKGEKETEKEFIARTIANPLELVVWLYENQGEQRFGADPRFFVILVDAENLDESWKLKKEIAKIKEKADEFFAFPTQILDVSFEFKKKPYQTKAGAVFISRT